METRPAIALITARLESRRVPFKNRLKVGGVSLWERAALFAMSNDLLAVVDTDDEVILEEAQAKGVQVHRRRVAREDEGGSHWEAIEDAAAHLGLGCFVLLQPTSPFRSQETLARCLALFDGSAPVFSCAKPGAWDGNIGVYPFPQPMARSHLARWVVQPHPYTLQIDTIADLQMAQGMALGWDGMPCMGFEQSPPLKPN